MSACSCTDVQPGTYANQETRLLPFATDLYPVPGTKPVGIDRCILPDVKRLWSRGIHTVESCCGHGSGSGYIAVAQEAVAAMLDDGWKPHADKPGRPEIFAWPRSET